MDRRKPQPPMVGSPRTHSLSSSAHGSTRTHASTSAARMATSRDSHTHLGFRSAPSSSSHSGASTAAVIGKTRHIPLENLDEEEDWKRHGKRGSKHVPEDPRLARHHVAATAAASSSALAGNGDSSTSHASKKRPKVPEKVSGKQIHGEKTKRPL